MAFILPTLLHDQQFLQVDDWLLLRVHDRNDAELFGRLRRCVRSWSDLFFQGKSDLRTCELMRSVVADTFQMVEEYKLDKEETFGMSTASSGEVIPKWIDLNKIRSEEDTRTEEEKKVKLKNHLSEDQN